MRKEHRGNKCLIAKWWWMTILHRKIFPKNRGCGEVAKSQRRRVSPEDLNHFDKGISIRKRNKPHKSRLHLEAKFCSFLPTGIFLISAKLDAKISSLSLADLARYQTFQLCM